MNLRKFRRVAGIAALLLLTNHSAHAAGSDRPAIVLVHAALLDGSSWNKVIAILQRAGLSPPFSTELRNRQFCVGLSEKDQSDQRAFFWKRV